MTPPAQSIIIGAGPAGLTAAYQLSRAGHPCQVLELGTQPGGLARTIWHQGYGFDIGGHRFFTKSERVNALWRELLGDDFISVRRLSRIHYNNRFFHYPLKPFNALNGLGPMASASVLASYLRRQIHPLADESNFESYIINRFGDVLYRTFFKTYTEKVWGMPCAEIHADWAAQRIKGLSLGKAMHSALFGERGGDVKSLIEQFHYPRLGPGMLWERMADAVKAAGYPVETSRDVRQVIHDGNRVTAIVHAPAAAAFDHSPDAADSLTEIPTHHVFSTMPLRTLLQRMTPAPPAAVLAAANALRYRDFITVNLILKGPNPFDDNWIYIHSPDVQVGRIQNFRNWSPDLTPPGGGTGLGMEYFCFEGNPLWNQTDQALLSLAEKELRQLRLAPGCTVEDGFVVRVKKAYPIYDENFTRHITTIRTWLSRFKNLHPIGRNGMHKYNNQDHSMITAFAAVENVLANSTHNLWSINSDSDYQEESEP